MAIVHDAGLPGMNKKGPPLNACNGCFEEGVPFLARAKLHIPEAFQRA